MNLSGGLKDENPIKTLGLKKCQRIESFTPADAKYYFPEKELYVAVLSDGYMAFNAGNGWSRSSKFSTAFEKKLIEIELIRNALKEVEQHEQ